MTRKGFVLLAASWLVVRLRVGILSTKLTLERFFNQPPAILVSRRTSPYLEGCWVITGEQLHFFSVSAPPETIEVRSLEQLSHN